VKFTEKTGKALAISLMFWCAGTGCMLVAHARAAAKTVSALATPTDPHACCEAGHKKQKLQASKVEQRARANTQSVSTRSLPPPASAMRCCPLGSRSMLVASRPQSTDRAEAFNQPDCLAPITAKSNLSPFAVPLRLPNRAHSYLLDCAFLI
jgi:hypothetical protein